MGLGSLNNENTTSLPPHAPWFYRIQRFPELLRTACRKAYSPSSNIAINEAIVAFKAGQEISSKLRINPSIQATSYGVLVNMGTFEAGSFIRE
jgi:hypothetical protein